MNVMEKRTRLRTIEEDIEHIDFKLSVLEMHSKPGADEDRIVSASWHLQRACEMLRAVSLTENPDDLITLLEVSIDGETRARRLCEIIGAETNNAG